MLEKSTTRAMMEGKRIALSEATVRKDTIAYAEWLRSLILRELRGQLVTLVTDGGENIGYHVYPALVYYIGNANMPMYDLVDVFQFPHPTTEAIVEAFSRCVEEMRAHYIEVFGAVTDNGGALVAAFGQGAREATVLSVAGVDLLRAACAIHTSLLVFADAERPAERGGLPIYGEFVAWLTTAVRIARQDDFARELKRAGISRKCDKLQPGKWNLRAKAATWLRDNHRIVTEVQLRFRFPDPFDGWQFEFNQVIDAINEVRRMVELSEGASVTLADNYKSQCVLIRRLCELTCPAAPRRNAMAEFIIERIGVRFRTTADGALSLLAYILTDNGRAEWADWEKAIRRQANQLTQLGATEASRRQLAERAEGLAAAGAKAIEVGQFFGHHDVPGDQIGRVFDAWLMGEFGQMRGQHPVPFFSGQLARCSLGDEQQGRRAFFNAAARLCRMPASEAAAERLFSVLSWLFDKTRASSRFELVRAELITRMWRIYHMSAGQVWPGFPGWTGP
jgi:hypothetical protein